jgi:bacillithiol system protein YtxJ
MPVKWIGLNHKDQLAVVLQKSFDNVVFIFKHSYRCSISTMAKSRLERSDNNPEIYLLDVIESRAISQEIAELLSIRHESPQLLVIINGKCEFASSHNSISSSQLVHY